jgi:predicted lipoprotein with Yx(FWY)xxD motif
MAPLEARAASSVFSTGEAGAVASNSFRQERRTAAKEAVVRRVPADTYQEVHMTRTFATVIAVIATAALAAITSAVSLAGGSAGGAVVRIADTHLGRILVDSRGITLYDFVADKRTTSVCYNACAALWPPLITIGKPIPGPGVKASLLGTTRRSDGKLEVTYGGHPLYYFVSDRHPGQTTGQGVNQFGGPWWVLSAAGKEIHRV